MHVKRKLTQTRGRNMQTPHRKTQTVEESNPLPSCFRASCAAPALAQRLLGNIPGRQRSKSGLGVRGLNCTRLLLRIGTVQLICHKHTSLHTSLVDHGHYNRAEENCFRFMEMFHQSESATLRPASTRELVCNSCARGDSCQITHLIGRYDRHQKAPWEERGGGGGLTQLSITAEYKSNTKHSSGPTQSINLHRKVRRSIDIRGFPQTGRHHSHVESGTGRSAGFDRVIMTSRCGGPWAQRNPIHLEPVWRVHKHSADHEEEGQRTGDRSGGRTEDRAGERTEDRQGRGQRTGQEEDGGQGRGEDRGQVRGKDRGQVRGGRRTGQEEDGGQVRGEDGGQVRGEDGGQVRGRTEDRSGGGRRTGQGEDGGQVRGRTEDRSGERTEDRSGGRTEDRSGGGRRTGQGRGQRTGQGEGQRTGQGGGRRTGQEEDGGQVRGEDGGQVRGEDGGQVRGRTEDRSGGRTEDRSGGGQRTGQGGGRRTGTGQDCVTSITTTT
ncbi:hypothetical protein WMY93_015423 [Mugilogobius chulae]|uniref:Uncharacterized protein n=1 Tax=Mugilogobius chulae TaxID=88201 RepID=A0AAW0P0E2_9GOBI